MVEAADRQRKRTERVTVRLRPRERRTLDEAAERRGVWVSELLREAALREVDAAEAPAERAEATT